MLKKELSELKSKLDKIEQTNQDYYDKYLQIERQNQNFASLYVASYQLHRSLDLDDVILSIREVVINLIGAEVFGIFFET